MLFWEWYQTITTAQNYDPIVKESFEKLLELEAEITEGNNKETRMHLNRVVKRTTYLDNDFIIQDVILLIIDRFIYSKNFRYNHEETEENRRQIMESSKENTPEISSNENSPEKTPEIITPESPRSETLSETNENQSDENQNENLDINTLLLPPEIESSDTESTTSTTSTNSNATLQILFENLYPNMNQGEFKEVMV